MLPASFIDQMTQLLGPAETEALCHAITSSEPCTSIRLNPHKTVSDEHPDLVPWCEQGRYLPERPQFTMDPLLHAGAYYVQEASSMFIEQAYKAILAESEDISRVIDLCAAPGGKSTLWRSLLPDGCLLVANEPMRQRAQILAENLTKWGHPDVIVTNAFPEEFSSLCSFFDVVAADVPCSGEGMFRKDEQAREEWSPEAVVACADRQWQIINDIWPTLREGGFLVYSTCTFNAQEDEEMVKRICDELGAETLPIPYDKEWGIVESSAIGYADLHGYHFYPHKVKGEGIFMALLRKTSEAPEGKASKRDKKGKNKSATSLPVKNSAAIADWLCHSSEFKFFRPDEFHLGAIRQSLYDDTLKVTSVVRALTAGILMTEEKGKKLIPQHALALSTELSSAFPREEVSLETALSYLRRESITLSPETPRGYVVVTYKGAPLGFVNNLGSRANNLYPEQWRIRKQI